MNTERPDQNVVEEAELTLGLEAEQLLLDSSGKEFVPDEFAEENGVHGDHVAAALLATPGPTTLAKLRGLPWSLGGNAFNSIFAQFTFFGSVFVLFLNTLGLSKSQIGGLLSLLPFTSVLALFIAPLVVRFGYKRTFLTAYGTRTVVTAFLLLTPWVTTTFGSSAALGFVTVIVLIFAILRAFMETGFIPWVQEYVPNAVRGKYAAKDNIYTTLAGLFSIIVAGITINRTAGLSGYMVLIGAGVLAGFVALWAFTFIPGGAPVHQRESGRSRTADMRNALQNSDYRRYLIGVSLITLGFASVTSFLPLYLQEQVGIPAGLVIWVQIGTLTGTLLSSYGWGWAADRYGSKPVMRTGAAMLIALPVLWWLIPRQAGYSLYFALGIAFIQGIAGVGWVIGAGRLLHVHLVPPEMKMGYMALYAAWIGIVSGLSQLLGGRVLDMTHGLSGHLGYFVLDPYVPLFLFGFVLTIIGQPVLQSIQAEQSYGVLEFAGLFFRGNPFMAMTSLIRNQMAKDEYSTVIRTEQLGRAGSRLTVEELIAALTDPRYSVRYEAEIAISKMRHDPRLTDAMVGILDGTELALSAQAAWALGRMGDSAAIEPLRVSMNNPYRSVRVQSIRALGWLKDTDSVAAMLKGVRSETDKGLLMAYASSLGNLGADEAMADLLHLLREMENKGARMELALAIARLIGQDYLFIRLIRPIAGDAGTAAAVAMTTLQKRIIPKRRKKETPDELSTRMDASISAFASGDLDHGIKELVHVLSLMPQESLDEAPRLVIDECLRALQQYGQERVEYLILALHLLNVHWRAFGNRPI